MTTTYVDIPGLVAVEQNYLVNSPILGDTKHDDQLKQIQVQFNSLDKALRDNNGSGIITEQNKMSQIVNAESARLATKQESIASAVTSQNRLITLNENYSKKYAEYIKMMLSLAGGLAIIAILIVLRVSSGLITVAGVLVGSSVLIYCTYIYSDISSRDNVYFDELNMSSMSIPASNGVNDVSGNALNLLGTLDPLSCFGSTCCSVGTYFDTSNNVCKVKKNEPFANSMLSNNDRNFPGNEKPWLPSEYESYTKI